MPPCARPLSATRPLFRLRECCVRLPRGLTWHWLPYALAPRLPRCRTARILARPTTPRPSPHTRSRACVMRLRLPAGRLLGAAMSQQRGQRQAYPATGRAEQWGPQGEAAECWGRPDPR